MSSLQSIDRQELGKEAERMARDFLRAQGLQVVLTNFRCRIGELDLVAIQGKVLVVVEVRMRTGMGFASAAASVGPRKQARIIRAARYLLLTRAHFRRYPIRFDVIALDRAVPEDRARIEWIKGAFEARGY